jgi:hypothetical protein
MTQEERQLIERIFHCEDKLAEALDKTGNRIQYWFDALKEAQDQHDEYIDRLEQAQG